jgi:hypothetical protein
MTARAQAKPRKKKPATKPREMTQAERLAEAAHTEEENKESLKKLLKVEEERKKFSMWTHKSAPPAARGRRRMCDAQPPAEWRAPASCSCPRRGQPARPGRRATL